MCIHQVQVQAVALIHAPFNLVSCISNFLERDTNKAFGKAVRDKVNRGAGCGLDNPLLYGPKLYVEMTVNTT